MQVFNKIFSALSALFLIFCTDNGGLKMNNLSLVALVCLALWGSSVSIASAAQGGDATEVPFAGQYRAINPETGKVNSTVLRVIPYQKGMEDENNLTDEQLALRAWVVINEQTKDKVFLDRMDDKDNEMSDSLKSKGWECVASTNLMLCGGPKGVQPFDGEDFTSHTGWLAILLHSGPLELVKCEAGICTSGDNNGQAAPDNNQPTGSEQPTEQTNIVM